MKGHKINTQLFPVNIVLFPLKPAAQFMSFASWLALPRLSPWEPKDLTTSMINHFPLCMWTNRLYHLPS